MSARGWIGVDLDGTLARYDGWQGAAHIGEPVPAMLARVKSWRAEGRDVKVFTARVAHDEDGSVAAVIDAWCVEHVGEALPVTCSKDYGMIELWDDRCVQVIPNTGARADGAPATLRARVMQTRTANLADVDGARGNCMAACFASVTGETIDVFDHVSDGEDWWAEAERMWLERGYLLVQLATGTAGAPAGLAFATGKTARSKWKHLVVVQDGELLHDPHPDGSGLCEVESYWLLLPWKRATGEPG